MIRIKAKIKIIRRKKKHMKLYTMKYLTMMEQKERIFC